jgi:splicing factor U2AF subunit
MGALGMGQPRTDRQARRLYVGNLPPTTEKDLQDFFNVAMETALVEKFPGRPVLSVYLNMEKRFGFVEFRTQEEATAALNLDGIVYGNFPLKMRRPSDYNANAAASGGSGPLPQLDVSRLGIVSTQVPDGPGKVFCGGLPYEVTEEQVRELLEAYGKLRAFHLVREKDTLVSKGYCFFEYNDISVTDEACKGLNDLRIGDRTLTVRRAYTKEGESTMGPGIDPSNPNFVAPDLMGGIMQMPVIPEVDVQPPSSVLCLLEMVTLDDLKDDEEFKEIFDEIKEECEKFGTVKSMQIPRQGTGDNDAAVGRVFIRYGSVEEATAARDAIGGRKFDNRTIVAQFYSEEKYNAGQLC